MITRELFDYYQAGGLETAEELEVTIWPLHWAMTNHQSLCKPNKGYTLFYKLQSPALWVCDGSTSYVSLYFFQVVLLLRDQETFAEEVNSTFNDETTNLHQHAHHHHHHSGWRTYCPFSLSVRSSYSEQVGPVSNGVLPFYQIVHMNAIFSKRLFRCSTSTLTFLLLHCPALRK